MSEMLPVATAAQIADTQSVVLTPSIAELLVAAEGDVKLVAEMLKIKEHEVTSRFINEASQSDSAYGALRAQVLLNLLTVSISAKDRLLSLMDEANVIEVTKVYSTTLETLSALIAPTPVRAAPANQQQNNFFFSDEMAAQTRNRVGAKLQAYVEESIDAVNS